MPRPTLQRLPLLQRIVMPVIVPVLYPAQTMRKQLGPNITGNLQRREPGFRRGSRRAPLPSYRVTVAARKSMSAGVTRNSCIGRCPPRNRSSLSTSTFWTWMSQVQIPSSDLPASTNGPSALKRNLSKCAEPQFRPPEPVTGRPPDTCHPAEGRDALELRWRRHLHRPREHTEPDQQPHTRIQR